jgi:membrane-bound serine protease (ClpP class)
LLALGLLGVYLEFKTPGFGVFGITGLLLLAIWFWGHNVAGLAGAEEIVIFAAGVILLALEIFVIPGFGIAGISGIILILASLMLAMVGHYPGQGWWHLPELHLAQATKTLGTTVAMCVAFIVIAARLLPKTPLFKSIMLSAAMPKQEGYRAGKKRDDLVGRRGIAESNLHPSGIAVINGRRQPVVSRGDFIDAGSAIVVAQTKGNRIVVDMVSEKEQA